MSRRPSRQRAALWISRRTFVSSSRSSSRLLTTSPMLTIPASLPPRSTGMWRTRWCVIKFITRLTLSSGDTVGTPYCMTSLQPSTQLSRHSEKMHERLHVPNETKNCVLTRHHESANVLCAEPVCGPLDAGFRSYCCDVGALPPQNAFDGHSLLPSVA